MHSKEISNTVLRAQELKVCRLRVVTIAFVFKRQNCSLRKELSGNRGIVYYPSSVGFPYGMNQGPELQQGHPPAEVQYRKDGADRVEEKDRAFFLDSSILGVASDTPRRLFERHFPESIPPTGKKTNPTRQCVQCSRKKCVNGKRIRKETRYYCPQCEVGLCVTPCFRIYHTFQ
ncbi:uncharacterized protein LOC143181854 [Calliopsis andreniformis]|uniref:uncharacterized protein LOC143181854 n=1 Tax=Calliopsis andreniformis TaxID=337506 RepID=UPI003FCC80FC